MPKSPRCFLLFMLVLLFYSAPVFAVSLDNDLDGISNLQERRDGTDPDDPADARAWHPNDMPDFPRLVGDQNRWDEVWQYVQDRVEPYYSFYRSAISQADQTFYEPVAFDYDTDACLGNARIARAAAIRFWGEGNPADAEKAVQAILGTDQNFEAWSYDTIDHGGILVSNALILLCQTYEILLVNGGFVDDEAEQAETTIKALTESFYHFYVERFRWWLMATRNNHNVRFDAGIGYVGITFNNWEKAAELVNFGLTEANYWQLQIQNCPGDGCCPEGPNYLSYSAGNYLPFFFTYHLFADGQTYPYKTSCANHVWPFCKPTVTEVADPVTDSRFAEQIDWWLHLRMPDGYGPPIDDSNLHCYPMGLASALTGDGSFRWVSENSAHCRLDTGGLQWETMMAWPDLPEAEPPADEDLFWVNEPAGQAVMRTSWNNGARYLLFNAEHGNARVQGMGHEQPDATSFIIHALGEMFMIDSGYIGFDDRELVAGPENHNLILVDGQGPPRGFFGIGTDVNAYFTQWAQDENVSWAIAESYWQNTDIRRLAALVDDDYFVVADWVNGAADHEYDWLGHTQAGGTTDGVLTEIDNGMLLRRGASELLMNITAGPNHPEIVFAEDVHGYGHGSIQDHAVLHATVDARQANFLAVFVPMPADDMGPKPTLEVVPPPLSPQDTSVVMIKWDVEDFDVWLATRDDGWIDRDLSEYGLPTISSDAELVLVRFSRVTNDVVFSWRKGGTYLHIED